LLVGLGQRVDCVGVSD